MTMNESKRIRITMAINNLMVSATIARDILVADEDTLGYDEKDVLRALERLLASIAVIDP